MDPATRVALAVSAIWVFLCVVFLAVVGIGSGSELGGLRILIVVLALGLPVALIWIGATAARSARIMREESERLQASMDAMRQIYVANAQMSATAFGPNVAAKIDEIARGQKRAETALAQFASRRVSEPAPEVDVAPVRPPVSAAPEPKLALEELPAPPQVSTADLIRALNFPEDASDQAGFKSLRRALSDPRTAPMIQASQDLLTLLSQDGIYMDDLAPERARPEVWRLFAVGERGQEISALGGIRDRASIALAAGRMRSDSIFRDTAHHFLRSFDRLMAARADGLSDSDLIRLGDTRTARAFMLMGRVAGLFD
jgi:hypothetical protein